MLKNFAVIVLLVIISVPLFLHLDRLPFRLWDESRLAANAYEMNKDGNFIVTHYNGEPEMWNTKPPLMIWLQVASIKLLGFNELAIRLPSALAGFATCLLLLYFSKRLSGDYLIGALASIVLVTTNGYVDIHAIRTGDYDGLLALFTTAFTLFAFLFFETSNKKWIGWFFAALVLAVLTKSVQALLFLPGILLYFLLKRKKILSSANITRHFLIGACCSIAMVSSYYLTREILNPGYLNAIWENELGGRYFSGLEENTGGPEFYIERRDYLFKYWIWFLPLSIVSGLMSKNSRLKDVTIYLVIVCISYFLFITFSKTKLYWYAVPLLPLLSMQVGIFLQQVYAVVKDKITSAPIKTALPALILIVIFLYPYYTIARKVYTSEEYVWDKMYPISNVLQQAFHGKTSVHNHVVSYTDFDYHLRIYANALYEKGQHVKFKPPDQLAAGDTVIASEDTVFRQIEKRFNYQVLRNSEGSITFLLK